LLKLFEKHKNYKEVKGGYAGLIENKEGSEIIKYNRANVYT